MRIFSIILIISLSYVFAEAVELSKASNSEILAELSHRLDNSDSSSTGPAIITGICTSGSINLQIDGTLKSQTISTYLGSDCMSQLSGLKKKLGSFSGVQMLAICSSGSLNRIKVNSTGDLSQSSSYIGSDCQIQANQINNL